MKTKLTDFKAKLQKHFTLIIILFITINHINLAQITNDCKENLLTDFNTGTWGAWYNKAKLTEDLDKVYIGDRSVEIPLNQEDGFYHKQIFSYSASSSSKFSLHAYGKCSSSTEWAGIGVHFFDANDKYITQQVVGISGNTWKAYKMEIQIPEGTKWFRVWVYKTQKGEAFFDGICLRNGVNCYNSLVNNNGNFEKGNLNNWSVWQNAVISNDEYRGSYAAQVKDNTGGAIYNKDFTIDPYKNYVLKAFGKKAGAAEWAGIGLHFFDEDENHIETRATEITGYSYDQYKLAFIPPSNAKYALPWFWKNGKGDLYVDDFCLIERPYCSNKKGTSWSSFNFVEHHFMNCAEYNPNGSCKDYAGKNNHIKDLNRKSPNLMKQLNTSWYLNGSSQPQFLLNDEGDTDFDNYFTEIEHIPHIYLPLYNDGQPQHACYNGFHDNLNSQSNYLMGFNEIELNNTHVDTALNHWKHMSEFDGQLGSLCTFDNASTNRDFAKFMNTVVACENNPNCNDLRVDFIQVHYYPLKNPNPAEGGYATGDLDAIRKDVKAFLEGIYNQWQKPIWITEFALMKPSDVSAQHSMDQQLEFMEAVISVFETTEYVHRYAWYGPFADKGYRKDANNNITKTHWQRWQTNLFEKNPTENKLTKLGVRYRDISSNKDCDRLYRLKNPDDSNLIASLGIPANMETNTLFDMQVSPNPSYGVPLLSFKAKEKSEIQIKLIDINGRVMFNSKVSAAEGINQLPLNLSNFQSGMYLIQINNGKEFLSSKVQLVKP